MKNVSGIVHSGKLDTPFWDDEGANYNFYITPSFVESSLMWSTTLTDSRVRIEHLLTTVSCTCLCISVQEFEGLDPDRAALEAAETVIKTLDNNEMVFSRS